MLLHAYLSSLDFHQHASVPFHFFFSLSLLYLSAMTTIVRFRPLLGAQEADGQGNSPLCYFLEVDGMRLLLDCGWNERFDAAQLEPLRQ